MKFCLMASVISAITMIAACSPSEPEASASVVLKPQSEPEAECVPSDIVVKSFKARFHDECRRRSCPHLKGVVTIDNTCPGPTGVQFQITLIDGSGAALATRDLWLGSTRNLPVGESVLSLDHTVDYQDGAESIRVEPIDVRVW